MRQVFERFRTFGLKFKPRKCKLFRLRVEFLGRTVSHNGVEMGGQCLEAVREWPIPRDVKAVERFLGFANYHRNYIPNFSKIAAPLYDLTEKKGFQWEVEQQEAFDKLISLLLKPQVWAIPTSAGHFILDTDALRFCYWVSHIQDDLREQ